MFKSFVNKLFFKSKENKENTSGFTYKSSIPVSIGEQIANAQSVINLHKTVFPKYKNIYKGREVVVLATGPTLNHYIPIKDAIHIGVNSACKQNIVNLDYLFAIDYPNIKPYIDEIVSYKGNDCKKLFGLFQDKLNPTKIPDRYATQANAERFFIEYTSFYNNEEYYPDYEVSPLPCFWSISFAAVGFALWTGASKIYLVGCDNNFKGHFDNTSHSNDRDIRVAKHRVKNTEGWQKLKGFVNIHYPNTEIISINPVNLSGLYNDVYTESYLSANPELREKLGNDIKIIN